MPPAQPTTSHGTSTALVAAPGVAPRASLLEFVQRDNWRNGFWIGQYGAQGYSVLQFAGTPDVLPPGCTVTYAGGTLSTNWVSGTDPRGLQVPGSPGQFGLGNYDSNGCTVTFQITDGLPHALSFYFWDASLIHRQQTIAVYDVTGTTVLEGPRDCGDYDTTGVYMTWNTSGSVQFKFAVGYYSAFFCAWFVDPPKTVRGRAHGTDTALLAPTAVFVQRDNWRNGYYWIGTYGAQGYSLLQNQGVVDVLPPSSKVTLSNPANLAVNWANCGPPGGLAIPGGGTAGVSIYYTSGSAIISITFQIGDDLPHAVSLYSFDTGYGWRGTLAAYDGSGGQLLDGPRDIGDYSTTGVYMTWNIRGAVQFQLAATNGNILIDGWFIDRPKSVGGGQAHGTDTLLRAPTASFVQRDNWRNGFWVGPYGNQGYSLAGYNSIPDVLPPSCSWTVPTAGIANPWYTGSDPRYPQHPDGSAATGLAAYYGGGWTMTFQLGDGHPHAISLFCLDAEKMRTQTITIYDITGTNIIDGPRDCGDFGTTGIYMTWNVNGPVYVYGIYTGTTGYNAVISAWFVDRPITVGGQAHSSDSLIVAPTPAAPTRAHASDSLLLGNLISWWRLDETATGAVAVDSAPPAANATDSAGTTTASTPAPINPAPNGFPNPGGRHFPGTTVCLDAGIQPYHNLTNNFTVAAWVRLAAASTYAVVGHCDNTPSTQGWLLGTQGGIPYMGASNNGMGTAAADAALTAGVWAHITGTIVAGRERIYVGGRLQAGQNGVVPLPSPTMHTYIGRSATTGTAQYYSGDIDDVRIYRVVLTNDQIQSLAGGNEPLSVTPTTQTHSTNTWVMTPAVKICTTDIRVVRTSVWPHGTDAMRHLQLNEAHDTDTALRATTPRAHGTSVTPCAPVFQAHAADTYLEPETAVFIQRDNWRQGAWIGQYGAQGYSLLGYGGTPDVLPPQCTVSHAGGTLVNPWVSGTDPRYLQTPSAGTPGLAAYHTPITTVVELGETGPHALTFYCFDANQIGRDQTIAVYAADGVTLLDGPRDCGDIGTTGVYMTWNVQGTIQFIFTAVNQDAVFSAWFIDSWIKVYGPFYSTDTMLLAVPTMTHSTGSFLVKIVASRSRTQRVGTRPTAFGD